VLDHIEGILRQYEHGQLSRRDALAALFAMTLPAVLPAETPAPRIGTATGLNHATLYVRDVARSQAFYQDLFGMPILTRQGPGVNLRAGNSFVGLYPVHEKPGIDHICLSVNHFDAGTALSRLRALSVNPEIVHRGDTEELYLDDPDGITVQIQDTSYRGGVGRLGNRNPA
jgi:catechol 2,3-dioxygenase-like lactoylglutathione lyase family enzyme